MLKEIAEGLGDPSLGSNHYICIFGNYITRRGYCVVIHNVKTREEAIKEGEKRLLERHSKDGWYLERCSQI